MFILNSSQENHKLYGLTNWRMDIQSELNTRFAFKKGIYYHLFNCQVCVLFQGRKRHKSISKYHFKGGNTYLSYGIKNTVIYITK